MHGESLVRTDEGATILKSIEPFSTFCLLLAVNADRTRK